MKKYLIIVLLCLTGSLFAQSIEQYTILLSGDDGNHQLKMQLRHSDTITSMEWLYDDLVIERANLFDKTTLLNAVYYGSNGQPHTEVSLNYLDGLINFTGRNNASLKLKPNTLDGGTLLYVLNYLYPNENEQLVFNVIGGGAMIFEMHVERVGIENIVINNISYEAYKYEMKIKNKLISALLPKSLYYWYSVDNHRFLKFEGPNIKGNKVTMELIDYQEF